MQKRENTSPLSDYDRGFRDALNEVNAVMHGNKPKDPRVIALCNEHGWLLDHN